jgi:hypothetical protein
MTGSDHVGGVRCVGATRDGGDDDIAVAQRVRAVFQRDAFVRRLAAIARQRRHVAQKACSDFAECDAFLRLARAGHARHDA